MHPAIRNPLRIHSGRARKGDLQFPVQAAPSCRPVCHCAIPPDAPRPFSSCSPAAPRRKCAPAVFSTSGLVPGDFVFLEFGLANEERVNVISVDTVNQTFTAIVTKNHPAGSTIRPSIWPTAVLLEGNDLAFDIKAVASPNAGSDLTVVVQT